MDDRLKTIGHFQIGKITQNHEHMYVSTLWTQRKEHTVQLAVETVCRHLPLQLPGSISNYLN